MSTRSGEHIIDQAVLGQSSGLRILYGSWIAEPAPSMRFACALCDRRCGGHRIWRTQREAQHMIAVGTQAPDFELTSDTGEDVKLSDYLGKKVILYFYPKALTKG